MVLRCLMLRTELWSSERIANDFFYMKQDHWPRGSIYLGGLDLPMSMNRVKTAVHRHAYRLPLSRESLTEFFFSGGSRPCHDYNVFVCILKSIVFEANFFKKIQNVQFTIWSFFLSFYLLLLFCCCFEINLR